MNKERIMELREFADKLDYYIDNIKNLTNFEYFVQNYPEYDIIVSASEEVISISDQESKQKIISVIRQQKGQYEEQLNKTLREAGCNGI